MTKYLPAGKKKQRCKMKVTKKQLVKIIREEKQKVIAEKRIRQVVRAALLNESWWSDQPWSENRKDHSFEESANSEYNREARLTHSRKPYLMDERHENHVTRGDRTLMDMYVKMQLQDVKEAGLKPEEIEQLRSLIANPNTGRSDVPFMYPAIVDRLDWHDPVSQEKFRPIADKVRKKDAEARAKAKAKREEEERQRREKQAKRKFEKSGKAYDKYLNSIADVQRNMDAVDELSRHVNAIAKAGGSVGEMAEDFIEEILEPSINYSQDDINGLLSQLDGEIKDAIMKKFNPSIASM